MHQFHYDPIKRLNSLNPHKVLSVTGLKQNMVFIDVGCNDGFFLLPALEIIGKNGYVYGIDIDNNALSRLESQLKKRL